MGDVADQLHLHPLAAGLFLQGGPHPGLDVVEVVGGFPEIRVLGQGQGLGKLPGPNGLHLAGKAAQVFGKAQLPAGQGHRCQRRQQDRQQIDGPEYPGGIAGQGQVDQDGQNLRAEDHRRQRHQCRPAAQALFHRPLQLPCPQPPQKGTQEGPPGLLGVVTTVVLKQPHQPDQNQQGRKIHCHKTENRHAPLDERGASLPGIAIENLIDNVQAEKPR